MAIKVTKPPPTEYEADCYKCGAEFTYELSDVSTDGSITCPSPRCGKRIPVSAKPIGGRTARRGAPVSSDYTLPDGRVLVLRCCHAGRKSGAGHVDFTWPGVGGEAVAPDWDPEPRCGGGLHGWLWGAGSVEDSGAGWAFSEPDVVWLVVEVDATSVVSLSGGKKVKFPRGTVVVESDLAACAAFIGRHVSNNVAIIGGTASAGYHGTATAGDHGTASAGYGGTASAGNRGTATAGDHGTASAGYCGTATAGDHGTASAGYGGTATAGDYGTASAGTRGTASAGNRGTATAGDHGTASAGYCGTATAGDHGTASAGNRGTATAGDYGTASAGTRGTASAGKEGVVLVKHWTGSRHILVVGNVGIDHIEPNVKYRTNTAGILVRADA